MSWRSVKVSGHQFNLILDVLERSSSKQYNMSSTNNVRRLSLKSVSDLLSVGSAWALVLELVSTDTGSALELVSGDTGPALELVSIDTGSALDLVSTDTGSALEFVSTDTGSALELVSADTGSAWSRSSFLKWEELRVTFRPPPSTFNTDCGQLVAFSNTVSPTCMSESSRMNKGFDFWFFVPWQS